MLLTRPGAQAATDGVVDAAAALGIPLQLLSPDLPALHALYGCDYALIRPDQYIAWCGDSLADAADVLGCVVGLSLEPAL